MPILLFKDIKEDLDQVYEIIIEELKSDQNYLQVNCSYLLQKRGKMIRSALILLAGRISNNSYEYLHQLGAAVEILHMATLVHDDIIDEGDVRRGLKTINQVLGSHLAVLLGDFFYARSLKILTRYSSNSVEIFSNIVSSLVEGEFLQYENSFKLDQNIEDYWKIIEYKTARFFANCCKLGAIAGKSSFKEQEALPQYGAYLGKAFQIRDDLLDFSIDFKKLGKSTYKDVTNGIYTLPILHALKVSREQDQLRTILQKDNVTENDFKNLIEIINNSGSLKYATEEMVKLCQQARNQLEIFPESKEKATLESLTYFNLKREF
ncbi:MAG: polyprenyl synthetase family protein [Halanaerobiales bacterium]|nr:polyprenyl synthetase family protein [Halanaerobiales bacterium]